MEKMIEKDNKNINYKKISVEDEIYEAETIDLMHLINKTDKNVENLLLVGHNPALSSLVSYISGIDSINLLPGMLSIIEISLPVVSGRKKKMRPKSGINDK